MNRQLEEKEIQMYNKHRRVFNLLAVRELQTKLLMRYWFSAFNSAKM